MSQDNYQARETYVNIITSVAGSAASQVDGIASVSYEAGLSKNLKLGKNKKSHACPADQRKAGREGNDGYFHPFIHKKISERTHVKGIQKGGTACQRLT